jgi:hypothetical protein
MSWAPLEPARCSYCGLLLAKLVDGREVCVCCEYPTPTTPCSHRKRE